MTAQLRAQLAVAQGVVRWACRRLPDGVRELREQEWLAELPAILADSEVRFAWVRAAKALLFAVGVARTARGMGRRRWVQRGGAITHRLAAALTLAVTATVAPLMGRGVRAWLWSQQAPMPRPGVWGRARFRLVAFCFTHISGLGAVSAYERRVLRFTAAVLIELSSVSAAPDNDRQYRIEMAVRALADPEDLPDLDVALAGHWPESSGGRR